MKWALLAAAALAVSIVRLRSIYTVIRVDGDSMLPTLADGDRLVARRRTAPRHGQIAVVADPHPIGTRYVIKRVAALPGDPVPEPVSAAVPDAVVPDGRLVLLGDNPDGSFDSRQHGFFKLADIHAITVRRLRQF